MAEAAQYTEVLPEMSVKAPDIKPAMRPQARKLDVARVEELAAIGLKPAAIGPAMGFSVSGFRNRWEREPRLREAWERGNSAWQVALATTLNGMALRGNIVAALFSAKQGHGLGWSDNIRTQVVEEGDSQAQKRFLEQRKKEHRLPAPPEATAAIEIKQNA